jgi:hypothetical protein
MCLDAIRPTVRGASCAVATSVGRPSARAVYSEAEARLRRRLSTRGPSLKIAPPLGNVPSGSRCKLTVSLDRTGIGRAGKTQKRGDCVSFARWRADRSRRMAAFEIWPIRRSVSRQEGVMLPDADGPRISQELERLLPCPSLEGARRRRQVGHSASERQEAGFVFPFPEAAPCGDTATERVRVSQS